MSSTKIKTSLVSFLLGILLGASALSIITGFHLDQAELEIRQLYARLADQSEQIAVLEKSLAQRQKTTVREIEIHVSFPESRQGNDHDKLEIEKNIKQLLKNVRGQEISALDPLLISGIIDGRTIKIANSTFLLKVKGTLISEKILMYVDAQAVVEE